MSVQHRHNPEANPLPAEPGADFYRFLDRQHEQDRRCHERGCDFDEGGVDHARGCERWWCQECGGENDTCDCEVAS